ncbi:MAG: hypothetical protein AAF372_02760 [Pseudomonadota bacterium]
MNTLLGKLFLCSSIFFLTSSAIAHPNHLFEIQNEVAHSHSGIEYFVVMVIVSVIGLILIRNKFK